MQRLRKVIYSCFWYFGRGFSYLYSYPINRNISQVIAKLYSAWISKEFNNFGKNSVVQQHIHLVGGKYISIGNKSYIGFRATLTAWDRFGADTFLPEIIIGNNVSFGNDCHITAINRIEIGNNVLTGRNITISDNSHGKTNSEALSIPPSMRPLYSAGPVYIEDGVWIGDKVTILSNVRIGKNSIIAANAVVTKDIPSNCVAGGIPAKVLKTIK